MRREIEGKGFFGIAVALTAVSFFCLLSNATRLNAQDFASMPAEAVKMAEQLAAEGNPEAAAECVEYYGELARRPLDINRAGEAGLRRLLILSEFQIRSLLDYVDEYGALLSESELLLVSGFNADLVAALRPFIVMGDGDGVAAGRDGVRHDAILRADHKFNPSSSSSSGGVAGKYRISSGERWEAGVTFKHSFDDTLRCGFLPTFASAGAAVGDLRLGRGGRNGAVRIETIVVGDFTARFGQGLAVWKAFPVTFASQPSALIKSAGGLDTYRSTSGTGFLRGAGATASFRRWTLSAFASLVSSLTVPGRSPKKRAEMLAGGNVSGSFKRVKAGATFCIGGKDSAVVAADFVCSIGRGWRAFGEAAVSLTPAASGGTAQAAGGPAAGNLPAANRLLFKSGHLATKGPAGSSPAPNNAADGGLTAAPALLAGAVFAPSYSFEAALLLRSYSALYIAPDAGAYSTLSNCANQQGLTLTSLWRLSKWTFTFNADAVLHPAPRRGVTGSSSAVKVRVDAARTIGEGATAGLRGSYSFKSATDEHRAGIRADLKWEPLKSLSLAARAEGCAVWNPSPEYGFLAFAEGAAKLFKERLSIRIRGTFYRTSSWATRIYAYEYDLPQTFSIPSFYGRGFAFYGIVAYRTRFGISLWAKASLKLFRLGLTLRL